MTDEEMAKEYAKLNARQYKHNDGIGFCTSEEEVEQAFLAGLKAGSKLDKVWHDYDAGEDCYEDTHVGKWVKRDEVYQLTKAKALLKEWYKIAQKNHACCYGFVKDTGVFLEEE